MVYRFNLPQEEIQRLRICDEYSRRHVNCIRLSAANSAEHEGKKVEICLKLLKHGHNFVCEASFSGGRADVFDLTEGCMYEVVKSEERASIELKKGRYPFPINVVEAKDANSYKKDENDVTTGI